MNIMPIDYYPMSADPNSQKQQLGEEKSRLNQEKQAVNESSSLTKTQKESINHGIESKTDNIKKLIHREDEKKAEQVKRDRSLLQRKRENDAEIEKQAEDTGGKYKRFDKII